ncbi:MAG: tetratricopeptide repeat protein [Nitrincola lacisaponensis]|uniref:tetratricopeptide repeat protein n=1 Tax=Nitrincola lacisaponensis TaxID=267850 RepID=UPI00391B974C
MLQLADTAKSTITDQAIQLLSDYAMLPARSAGYDFKARRYQREIDSIITDLISNEAHTAYMFRMMLNGLQNDVDAVRDQYSKAARLSKSSQLLYNYSIALFFAGDFEGAKSALLDAIKCYPGEVDNYFMLANYYMGSGDILEAVSILMQGKKLNSSIIDGALQKFERIAEFVQKDGIEAHELKAYFLLQDSFLHKERLQSTQQYFGLNQDEASMWISNVIKTELPPEKIEELNDEWIDTLLESNIPAHVHGIVVTSFI